MDIPSPTHGAFVGRPLLSPPQEIDEERFFSEDEDEYMRSNSSEVQVFEDNDSEGDDVVVLSQQQLQQQYQYMGEQGYLPERMPPCGVSPPAIDLPLDEERGFGEYGILPNSGVKQYVSGAHYVKSSLMCQPDQALKPISPANQRISPSKATAVGPKKPSTPVLSNPSDPSITSACELVQQIYDQIALHDSPAVNDSNSTFEEPAQPSNARHERSPFAAYNRVSSQRHDASLQSQLSQAGVSSFDIEDTSNASQPGLLRQELQLHKLGGPLQEQPRTTHGYFKHLQKQPESKMGHVALGTLCSWTLDTLQATPSPSRIETKKENYIAQSSQTPLSTAAVPNQMNNKETTKSCGSKNKWSIKSYWKNKKKSGSSASSAELVVDTTSAECERAASRNPTPRTPGGSRVEIVDATDMQPNIGYTASVLTVSVTPKRDDRGFFPEDRFDEDLASRERGDSENRYPAAGNSPVSGQIVSTRLQMFGSEYARYLSTSAFAPKIRSPRRLPQQSASSRYGPFSARSHDRVHAGIGIQMMMGNSSFDGMRSKQKRTGNAYSWNLEDQDNAILAGAIVDICITNGADSPPPKGYYRISQTVNGEEFKALRSGGTMSPRRKSCAFINVKKEPNWHRASQRPCVTALTVIFPDRQEFVPPGFCVVREHRRTPTKLNHGKRSSDRRASGSNTRESTVSGAADVVKEENGSLVQDLPANFNQGATDGERVYLCFRRSREGNPITGILPLQPAFQEAIPDGYTVLERTPRNNVAILNPKNSSPIFLAYRQRLANLEPLRPLPLVLSVTAPPTEAENNRNNGTGQKRNKKPRLNAYYCTGGTVVEADVGRYHIMDRSTHALLSATSVAHRLSLIELSRKKSLPQLTNGDYGVPTLSSSNVSETSRPLKSNTTTTEQSSQTGDFDSVSSSLDPPSLNTSFGAGSSIAEYPKDVNSSFSTTGSLSELPIVSSCVIEENTDVPSVIISSFPASNQQADGYYPKLHDSELKMTQDAMNFIPVVEIATPPSELEPQRLLRARTTLLTPILTACYQRHGGAALKAVEGLTKLLMESDFFANDVDWSSKRVTTRLTLLDLAIQVVCDVATGGAQETTFGACTEFVENAIQYCQGHVNTRTTGYVLRFYLFVYYFGASIPANKAFPHVSWSSPKDGNAIMPILYNPRNEKQRHYLPGGAPQMAALGFKDLITFTLTRLQRVCLAMPDGQPLPEGEGCEKESTSQFMEGLISSLIDGAVHRIDIANYTQLAMHQIHRSGGSELFWHDMMTSCGMGLFGHEASLIKEAQNMYVMSFAILANLIKVASGKIRTNAQTHELRPRDVSSKLLSLELLLHFLEQYKDEQQGWMEEERPIHRTIARCVDTMVFCIRRLVVPCLFSNTRAGLDDPRVFMRMVQILSVLMRTPLYRNKMKGEIGMLIEHFGLRILRLGPQLQRTSSLAKRSSSADDITCPLLFQQIDLVKEIKRWFSNDSKSTIEMYLNFDTDISTQVSGPSQLLPGTQWKVFQRICASLCNLAEQCGDLIGDQIRESQSLESPTGSNKPKLPGFMDASSEAPSNEKKEQKKAEMESVREGARNLRKASLDAIVQILKCLARTSAVATGKEFYTLISAWLDSSDHEEFQDEELPDIPYPAASVSEDGSEEEERLGGPGSVLNYWRNQAATRKKSRPYVYTFDHEAGLLNSVTRETAFEIARKKNIKKAVEYLVACSALSPSPRDIASFLRIHKDKLDQGALGSYLGEGGTDGQETEYWNLIRFSYVRAISFDGMKVEDGLRHFLTNCGFRLPGEAQKIDRIMSTFAQCYWEDNAGDTKNCPFQDQDTVYLLAFAVIMLNTDLHKSGTNSSTIKGSRKKISKQEFIKNLAGVEGAEELTREYLSGVYDSIEATPIILMHDDLDAQNLAGPDEARNRMLRSMLGNVRSADALLRGLSVHDFKWASMQDFSSSLAYEGADALSDLTRSCISESWHQFHGVVNTALETAHLDPQGMEPCVDLLKYALVVTICLDMPTERAAFLSQLGRFKVFEGHRNSNRYHCHHWVPDEEQGRQLLLQNNPAFDRAISGPLDDDSKLKALVQVHEATLDLRSALKVDIEVKREMARITDQILDGEFLLNDPGRSFVRMGDLKKKSNRSGRQMEYRFFLFSDVLMYTKKLSSSKDQKENHHGSFAESISTIDKKDSYKIHEELPLHLMKVVDWFPPSVKDMKKAFQVHHPRKTFVVFCSSEEERLAWVRDIRTAIKREIQRKMEMEAARMAATSISASASMNATTNVRVPTPRPY